MESKRIFKLALTIISLLLLPTYLFSQQINEILGRPTDQSVTVSVLLPSPGDVYFEYGTSSTSLNNISNTFTSSTGNMVEEDLSGLQAETRYYYRTRYKLNGQSSFAIGETHSFITQRKVGSKFVFTIESDPHPYDKKGSWGLWPICLQNQLNDNADFMIDMGDTWGDDHDSAILSTEVQSLQLSCRNFFGKVCHSMPFIFCIGNHEGEFGYYLNLTPPNNLATYETKWRKTYFPNPYPNNFYTGNTEIEGSDMGQPENYFAWQWGDALFVVLDMYRYADANSKPQQWDWTIGKTQYDWFKQTLANSSAKYKFVFSHHILGQGRGGTELAKLYEWGGCEQKGTYTFDKKRVGWDMPIHQLMKFYNVDAYFQGHDHIYVKQELDGIVYQSVPMPSDSTYIIGMRDNGSAYTGIKFDGSGHLRVTVESDSVIVDYVSARLPADESASLKNGDVVYSYSIKKSISTAVKSNIESSNWNIYPNPTDESASIYFNEALTEDALIQINSMDGKLIKQIQVKNSELIGKTFKLNLQNEDRTKIESGVYLVSISLSNGLVSHKKLIVN